MNSTKHARDRMQQRGLPPIVIDLLLKFGIWTYRGGAIVRHFDRRARRKADEYTGGLLGRNGKWSDAYLVVSQEGSIITLGHRYSRIKHH